MESGNFIEPTVSLGFRGDGKDKESFHGMELKGDTAFKESSGWTLSGSGIVLVSQLNAISETGLWGSAKFDRNSDGLGVLYEFLPSWGRTTDEPDVGLWSGSILEYNAASVPYTEGLMLKSELGYGQAFLDGAWIANPYVAIKLDELGRNHFSLGNRIDMGEAVNLDVEGTENWDSTGGVNHSAKVDGTIKW